MQRTLSLHRSSAPAAKGSCKPSRTRAVRVHASGTNGKTRSTTIHKLIEEFGTLTMPGNLGVNRGTILQCRESGLLPTIALLFPAGCYDSLSVKILQQAGHKAAYVSGAAVSATQLGEPDLGLLAPPEMARRTGQICGSIPDFPVLADADTGGGSILNVQRTVRSLIAAGASGCILEDQKWPKRIGYMRNKEVINREEFVAKILAAREVIGDSDFFLIARTDARSTSAKYGLEDAIARANLYIDAGADAQLVGGVRSVEELNIIGAKTYGLRVANMVEGGVTPLCTAAQLSEMGFNIAVFPLSAIFTATRALVEIYGSLAANGTSQEKWDDMVSWRAFNDILGIEERLSVDDHFTKVKGPASNIGQQLRVKVKGLVKSVSVQ